MSYRVLNLRRLNEIDSYGFTPDQLDQMLDEESAFDYKEEFKKTGNKKYVLDTDDTKKVITTKAGTGYVVHRVIYKDGSKGGYIQYYDNLSQDGKCKVLDNAIVWDYAQVLDNAVVKDNAMIMHDAIIKDNAIIYGNARIYGNALITGNAKVNYTVGYDEEVTE